MLLCVGLLLFRMEALFRIISYNINIPDKYSEINLEKTIRVGPWVCDITNRVRRQEVSPPKISVKTESPGTLTGCRQMATEDNRRARQAASAPPPRPPTDHDPPARGLNSKETKASASSEARGGGARWGRGAHDRGTDTLAGVPISGPGCAPPGRRRRRLHSLPPPPRPWAGGSPSYFAALRLTSFEAAGDFALA